MATQLALDKAYIECAFAIAKLSHATRRKVGVIIVSTKTGIIAEGLNGMPSGFDNNPEEIVDGKLATKPECLHAEANAITKIARSTNSSIGATLYCTLEPCFSCVKLIIPAGIARVVYAESYVGPSGGGSGIELLEQAGILVEKYDG